MAACSGIRVLEVADGFCAGSLCGQLFAGLGAEVVKWEPAAGDSIRSQQPLAPDGTSHAFHITNAGKESVARATEPAAAAAQWESLVRWADVVLWQHEPGSAAQPGFDPEPFCAQWPDKILCSISMFGLTGKRRDWVGNEFIAEAIAGLMSCTGYADRPPVRSGVPYALHVSGLFAFNGLMAALWERDRSGRGQWVDVAVADCVVTLLGNFIPGYFLRGRSPERIGNRHTTAAPWNLYPTADRYVVICTGSGGNWWKKISDVIGRPELGDDERYDEEMKRRQRVDEVDALIEGWTARHTADHVMQKMLLAGVPASEIVSVESALADPHYGKTRAMTVAAPLAAVGDAGQITVAGLPLKVGAWAPPAKAGPGLGSTAADSKLPRPPSQPTGGGRRNGKGALHGVRVIEFGGRTSVPLAGRFLADLGAEVIKIEPPKGEGQRTAGQIIGGASYLFHINNAGKRSVVIDPKNPAGRELILELVAHADVWIENLAPGSLDAMGLGYSDLAAVNPKLIYGSCTGFGHKSDYGKKRALDAVVQAACGIIHMTGYPDHLPVKIGLSAVDLSVAIGLVGAVIGGLRERRARGAGLHLDLAMADIGVWMTQSLWPDVFYGSGHPARTGNRSSRSCPHNLFAASNGWVALAVDTDRQWQSLAALVAAPELTDDPTLVTLAGRLSAMSKIEAALSAWMARHSVDEAVQMLQGARVAAAPVREIAEIVADADVRLRRLIVEVTHPLAGVMKILGNPLQLSGTPVAISSCAPTLGQHTHEILRSLLGMPGEKIERLRAAGAIVTEVPQQPA